MYEVYLLQVITGQKSQDIIYGSDRNDSLKPQSITIDLDNINYVKNHGYTEQVRLFFADNSTMTDSELAAKAAAIGIFSRERRQIKDIISRTASAYQQPVFFKVIQWLTNSVSKVMDTLKGAVFLGDQQETVVEVTLGQKRFWQSIVQEIEYLRATLPKKQQNMLFDPLLNARLLKLQEHSQQQQANVSELTELRFMLIIRS